MQKSEALDAGWQSSSSTITMILSNKNGDTRKRTMISKTLEAETTEEDDGDKRLIIFEYPPDVRGTKFLTYSHKQSEDDQWLYLPALKRIKRIASRSKSNSFMGSEFSYEDIAGQELEKFNYRWLRDEDYNSSPCFVIESTPTDLRNSSYLRRITWMDKQHYYIHKADYYDRKNKHLKTLYFTGYQRHLDIFWRASAMEMINIQNERSTKLQWNDLQLNIALDQADFSQRILKR